MRRRRVCVVNDTYAEEFLEITRGIIRYSGPRDRWELIAHRKLDLGEIQLANADGILLNALAPGTRRRFRKPTVPAVSMFGEQWDAGWGIVQLDDRAIGKLAAEHLMSKGLKRFAYWGEDMPWDQDRLAGFRSALQRQRQPCLTIRDISTKAGGFDWRHLLDTRLLRKLLARLEPPAAVMACNDNIGLLVMRTAGEMGLHVPDQIAVIGVNNNLMECELTPVSLSSVDPNSEAMGYAAAEMLDRMMEGEPIPDRPLLVQPRGIVERRSTNALAVEDREVRAALAYIREYACEGITVADVLGRVLICRRLLEQRFRQAIGHSPGQEIRRVKLQRAAGLLRDTTLKLGVIAGRCGYKNADHLSAAFTKEFGVNTRSYRRK